MPKSSSRSIGLPDDKIVKICEIIGNPPTIPPPDMITWSCESSRRQTGP